MIGIIDYNVGNLASVMNAFRFADAGEDVVAVSRPEDLQRCRRVVLPGVGAFANAMVKIRSLGFDAALKEQVAQGKPLLGVCLGMQLLASSGDEGGRSEGLGLIPGHVEKITWQGVKVPHMGWNSVEFAASERLFASIPNGSDFYFVHSYHFVPEAEQSVVGRTPYGNKFVSVVGRDNVWGVQFHPEKSQRYGITLLKNFIEM